MTAKASPRNELICPNQFTRNPCHSFERKIEWVLSGVWLTVSVSTNCLPNSRSDRVKSHTLRRQLQDDGRRTKSARMLNHCHRRRCRHREPKNQLWTARDIDKLELRQIDFNSLSVASIFFNFLIFCFFVALSNSFRTFFWSCFPILFIVRL